MVEVFNFKSRFRKGNSLKDFFNLYVLYLGFIKKYIRIYFVWFLTCCFVFQSESSSSSSMIRLKMNEKAVAWRDLAICTWKGIPTILISQHRWCSWTTIINSQWITEIIIVLLRNTKLNINHNGKFSRAEISHPQL